MVRTAERMSVGEREELMREEFDLTKAVPGRHSAKYAEGVEIKIDEDGHSPG